MVWDDVNENVKQANEQYSFSELKEEKLALVSKSDKKTFNEMYGHEAILIYGQPKTGKTYAACSFIENIINNGGNIFYINTDNGLFRTLQVYFKENFEGIKNKINYYLITDLKSLDEVIKDVKNKVKSNDLIVIDLLDDFWEMSQTQFVQDVCDSMGIKIVDYIITASKEKEKFGLLDANKWNYAKKFDDIIIRNLIIVPPCNVIACCGAKDIEIAKIFAKKDEDKMYELSKYEEVGSRPAGQKSLAYKFNTVIYLGELRNGKRFFTIMGDRGFLRNSKKVEYQDSFYNAFSDLSK